ncbi:MerR family transcriptional regulator [Ureibacillus terrenus]|uniref:MerR family transcriptional regulator n=1 Tax=Ureibacillus terrenus TaxID=118246 RepID=A0A540V6Y0_9BACL|nr:MerR family transcriptional regulator [Ureibacillus terrenus]MED3762657.1 MerR family transcriptional regulator [Ureibacillus terrenus]TQE92465.1 MerR family transcriptional regulator [Ureibacillus terrenus]
MVQHKKRTSEIRRSMPLLPIGTVIQLTDLTARQIRYYEEQGLICPHRTEGNQRMFSLNDVDLLLEIKDLLEQGLNIAGIKKVFEMKNEINGQRKSEKELFDEQIRSILREEMKMAQSHLKKPKLRYADVIRYYQ